MLKIYPTLVLKNTGLYKLYNTGNYSPYSDDDMIDLLIEVKKMVPPWIRIMRVQREIESKDIIAGPKKGNLRQIVLEKLKKMGLKCSCIRCREIGLQKVGFLSEDEVMMNRIDYAASDGQEVFLSFETKDSSKVLGFLRLRKVTNPYRNELQFDELYDVNNNNDLSTNSDYFYPYANTNDLSQKKNITSSTPRAAAVVRELHVYGQMINVGNRGTNEAYQHRGYGVQLMAEAEKIAKYEFGVEKLSVISAIGTREYYKKMGYVKNGPYVTKVLQ
jgi:elongator complex protein 3